MQNKYDDKKIHARTHSHSHSLLNVCQNLYVINFNFCNGIEEMSKFAWCVNTAVTMKRHHFHCTALEGTRLERKFFLSFVFNYFL